MAPQCLPKVSTRMHISRKHRLIRQQSTVANSERSQRWQPTGLARRRRAQRVVYATFRLRILSEMSKEMIKEIQLEVEHGRVYRKSVDFLLQENNISKV